MSHLAQEAKCAKCIETCITYDFGYALFSFSVYVLFGLTAKKILDRFCHGYVFFVHVSLCVSSLVAYLKLSFALKHRALV